MGGRNLYADVNTFRRHFLNDSELDVPDAPEVERVLEAASRQVDETVRRPGGFFSTIATRHFDGNGLDHLPIPDLLAVTSVKLDEDGDRTFELTLSAVTDYYLRAAGGDLSDQDAYPKVELVLDAVNGQRSVFMCGRPRLVEIAGRWGYTEATERLAPTATLADGTTTEMPTSDDGDLSVGQTIKLGSGEVVYIAAGDSGAPGSPWTVVRGVNGSTATGGADMAMDRYVYPAEVHEATLIFAGRMWKRRSSGYSASVAGTPLAGGSDPVAERLLSPFTRWSSFVA